MVWFVEKGRDGATTLYPLSDFKPRKKEGTYQRYLTGAYGAVPDVFEGEFGRAVLPDGYQAGVRATG
jgi:hypothetical protein